jgi:hypothetical protein
MLDKSGGLANKGRILRSWLGAEGALAPQVYPPSKRALGILPEGPFGGIPLGVFNWDRLLPPPWQGA